MTMTDPSTTRTARRGSGQAEETAPTAAPAPPPKLRRRPFLVVASVAAVCTGAAVSLWAYNSTSTAIDVLAVRQTVERGQVISAEDLMTVKVSVDPALAPLPASEADSIVGQRAALDLAAGGVVTAEQITDTPLPADGSSVVGVSLTSAMLPAQQIRVGDRVRIVSTPGEIGDVAETDDPEAVDAEVVGISSDEISGNTILNVQVSHELAPSVAARAATGKVAVVLDSSRED